MDSKKMLKMAVISGAAHALKYKKKEPNTSDEEILRRVNAEVEEILDKLGSSY